MDNDKPRLHIQREDVAPCRVKLTVELPAEQVAKTYDECLRMFNRKAPVKGFRPGKIPRQMLVRRFGQEILEQTKGELLQKSVEQAIEQEGLEPETRPVVEDLKTLVLRPGESFVFAVSFDTTPQFELPDYNGIEATRDASAISEDTVGEWLDNWLERQAHFVTVDRPAMAGDMLKATYKAEWPEDAEELPATAKFYIQGEDSWLPLRDPELLPGITALMEGCKAGDERDVEITFPEDHGTGPLAGKTLAYHIAVAEVQSLEKPELDDELARKAGLENADEIRQRVRENMEAEKKNQQESAVREQVLRSLLAKVQFDLPPTVLNRTVANAMQALRERLTREGASPEDLRNRQQELLAQANEQAVDELRRLYLLGRIAEAEDITIDNREAGEVIDAYARMHKVTPKLMLRRLQESGRINQILLNLREAKTVDRLVALAKVTETDGGKE